jgi:hypothetical protein
VATLTTQQIIRGTPIAPTFAAAAGGGDACTVGIDTFVEIKNTSGTSTVVTFAVPAGNSPYSGVAYTSPTVTVPITTGDKMFGPIDPGLFKDPTTGLCTITYSQVSGITVGVFNLSEA